MLADLKLGAVLVFQCPQFENQCREEGQVGSEWGRVALSRANCLLCGVSHGLRSVPRRAVFLLGPRLWSSAKDRYES